MQLIIVGVDNINHVGKAFLHGAKSLNINSLLIDSNLAYQAPKLIKQLNWHLRGRYPTRLNTFSQEVLTSCINHQPQFLLTTGICPLNVQVLQEIGKLGITKINFLTDDPWNPIHLAPWFFPSLPHYDIIYSPRKDNMQDLEKAGCKNVKYLPFAYNRDLFYPEKPTESEKEQYISDVIFAGGGDSDRVQYISALIKAGMKVHLYGGYWDNYPATKGYSKGFADSQMLRKAIATAKISLCLVRKANRDGNCMRTFEVPAIGGCMLTEYTQEHQEIFGLDGENVVYFKTIPEMVEKALWLLDNESERQKLANNAHLLITQGGHTYGDRLKTMLELCS